MPENLPVIAVPVPEEPAPPESPVKKHGGMWLPGQSGNPAGRPKGSKNHLTELKRELEIAVRDNLNPKVIRGILERMAELALLGDVKAAKLLLDKVLSNAGEGGEEAAEPMRTFVFQVKNLTLKHDEKGPVAPVLDAEFKIVPPTPQEPEK